MSGLRGEGFIGGNMAGSGVVCVVTDSVWVAGRVQREAACRLQRSPCEIEAGGVAVAAGRLKMLSYKLLIADVPHGVAEVCERLGLAAWSERTFLAIYVRRQERGSDGGRFYAEGALRAQDRDGGDQAWRSFAEMCARVGVDARVAFGVETQMERV